MQRDNDIKQAQGELFRQYTTLAQAAGRLYFAGVWKLEDGILDAEQQKILWQQLRDAMGLNPNKAAKVLRIGEFDT